MPAGRRIPHQPRPYVIVAEPARRKPRAARIPLLPAALVILAAVSVHATASRPGAAAHAMLLLLALLAFQDAADMTAQPPTDPPGRGLH